MRNLDRRGFLRLTTAALAGMAAPFSASAREESPGSGLKVGIIGSGRIGGTLGRLWAQAGHPVLFSSRHPEQLQSLAAEAGPLARAGTPQEAAAFGDAVLIAVPYRALPDVGRECGRELAGKVVLDANNAVAARDGEAMVADVRQRGIGTVSADYLPGVRLVRAFNTLNFAVLAREAHPSGGRVAIPLAGDDQEALAVASGLVRDAGFDPVVVGALKTANLFAMGGPLYGLVVTADEFKSRLESLK